MQGRPGQQDVVCEHCWPADGQVAPGWQVPLVWPAGMEQERPVQQSPVAVQVPSCGWQDWGGEQRPPVQIVEQHCDPVVHAVPLAWQAGWHVLGVPVQLPEQHWEGVVQAWPSCVQVGGFWQVLLPAQ